MPLDPTKTSKTLDVAKTVELTGDADVGDVLQPKTFYKDDPATKLTGTMPTVAIVAANDNYPAGYHAGNVGGLDAIDAELAPANIKNGVTIFGVLGTYSQTITHDTEGSEVCADDSSTGQTWWKEAHSVLAGSDFIWATTTVNCNQATVLYGFGAGTATESHVDILKVRLYIDGVQQAETGYIPSDSQGHSYVLVGHKSVASGNRTIQVAYHNYSGFEYTMDGTANVAGGCAKVV